MEDGMSTRSLKDAACIVGVGETAYSRRSDRPVEQLILDACTAAIREAGLRPEDIDGITSEGNLTIRYLNHDEVALSLGIGNHFSATSASFGAGIAGSVLAAAEAIASGTATTVLCYFGTNWGTTNGAYGASDREGSPKAAFEVPHGFYGQPMYFAHIATQYQHEFDVNLEYALGSIALQTRKHALLSGTAQMNREMSRDQYLKSEWVAEPLRIPDCCLLSDGAAAVIVTSADRAAEITNSPVYIKGGAFVGGPVPLDHFFSQNPDFGTWSSAQPAAQRALGQAGATLNDLDFVEVYDCFTMTTLMQLESLGYCKRGEGADFVGDGARIAINGEIPVNTHGGLLSHDYMLGMSHIVEATRQLRGQAGANQVKDASLGMVGLLTGAQYCALVFGNIPG
jgi:acetyl-CoA acetyltransferase